MILPYGYIDMFAAVGFNTPSIKPMRCRLRSPATARIVSLASGQAFNAGNPGLSGVWPVEQVLTVLIRAPQPGDGLLVDTTLQTIAAKQGTEGTLRVRVPGGNKNYSAPAVLDFVEIENEGRMDDNDVINWVLVALHFSQMNNWTVA